MLTRLDGDEIAAALYGLREGKPFRIKSLLVLCYEATFFVFNVLLGYCVSWQIKTQVECGVVG